MTMAKKVGIQVRVESKYVTPRSFQLLPDAKKVCTGKMVSLDGDPIMETKQVCDESPGEVDSVGESAIWTAQQEHIIHVESPIL